MDYGRCDGPASGAINERDNVTTGPGGPGTNFRRVRVALNVRVELGRLCLPLAMGCALAMLAGCASSGSGGDPGAKPLPVGQSCQSIKAELDRMVGRGVQGSVEAQSAGKKLSPQQKADADRYNQLLAQYLGARCHVL